MNQKKFKLEEIAKKLEIEAERLEQWAERELVIASKEDDKDFFVEEDLERFRIIRNLVDDLDVNLEGVEVILPLRGKVISMEKWIRDVFKILDEHQLLNEELLEAFKKF